MPLKIMLSAAEVSGDLHASRLARELKGCSLFGMGGEKMKQAGVDVRIDITDKSTVGVIEALKYIPSHLSTLKKLKALLVSEHPDALILIDAQAFNMPLAEHAKKIGIKTIYYIAPQEWLWGTKKGVKSVARTLGLIISTFRKEHETYISAGGNSAYFGHPLLDIARPSMDKEAFQRKFGIDPKRKVIALCPGSRTHEIKNLLPILIEASGNISDAQYLMPIASSRFSDEIRSYVAKSGANIKVIEGYNYDVLAYSDLVIAKSGTVILECVCLGTPVIMFYKLSRLTYYIGRYLLKIRLPFYSMPNILAGRMIVPEYVMEQATAGNLSREAKGALEDPLKFTKGYQEVRAMLGTPGAVKKAAQKIIEFISSR